MQMQTQNKTQTETNGKHGEKPARASNKDSGQIERTNRQARSSRQAWFRGLKLPLHSLRPFDANLQRDKSFIANAEVVYQRVNTAALHERMGKFGIVPLANKDPNRLPQPAMLRKTPTNDGVRALSKGNEPSVKQWEAMIGEFKYDAGLKSASDNRKAQAAYLERIKDYLRGRFRRDSD